MLKQYLDQRSASRCHATIIQSLKLAAGEAAERGDTAAALAFQQEIDRLYKDLAAAKHTRISPRPAKDGEEHSFNASLLALQWGGLQSTVVHASKSACVIDCGERGRVAITPFALTLSGELAEASKAIFLGVRHAQLHWNCRSIARGSDETKFKMAVAAKMLGVKMKGAKIPRARRAEADALMEQWNREFEGLLLEHQPRRPGLAVWPGLNLKRFSPARA